MTDANVVATPKPPEPMDWATVIVGLALTLLAASLVLAVVSGARTWGTGYR